MPFREPQKITVKWKQDELKISWLGDPCEDVPPSGGDGDDDDDFDIDWD